jgi:adenylate cyclase
MRGPSIIDHFMPWLVAVGQPNKQAPEEGIMSLRISPSLARLDGFAFWLADHAELSLLELHKAFSEELVARGLPLWKSSLGLELLHPEQSGVRSLWSIEHGATKTLAPRGVENTPDYLNSPVRVVDETDQPFRQRLDGPIPSFSILQGLKDKGATDYLILPLPFLDRSRSAYLSFVTRDITGFSESDIEVLEAAGKLLSPYIERLALRRMAIDLLDTYVGHHAGERIFSGQIRRGALDEIEAAILMSDLRGFTLLSKQRERPIVVETLNAWFDSNAVAVEAHGGEVLKFMGDGLLAIFRAEIDAADAVRRAYAASVDVRAAVAEVNVTRASSGDLPMEFAMGLHVGEVAYGNVGGQKRLDFTVLGQAVNYASRLQNLAKRLGQPVLISSAFANYLPEPLVAAGAHAMRDIGRSERVFSLPEAA